MFGHTVGLNFEQKGHFFHTSVGGCCSSMIQMLVFSYVIVLIKRIHLFEKDDSFTALGSLDIAKEPPVPFSNTHITPFYYLK